MDVQDPGTSQEEVPDAARETSQIPETPLHVRAREVSDSVLVAADGRVYLDADAVLSWLRALADGGGSALAADSLARVLRDLRWVPGRGVTGTVPTARYVVPQFDDDE